MGMLISLVLALAAAFLVYGALNRLASRGALDSGTRWFTQGPAWIIVFQLSNFVLLWLLKSLEVGYEADAAGGLRLYCGFIRRLDDVSWWTMIMGTVVGVAMIWSGGGLELKGLAGRRALVTWRVLAGLGLALYVLAGAIGHGTFFWSGSAQNPAAVARLQCVEGGLVMGHILTSYAFLASLVSGITRRTRGYHATAFGILVGGVAGLIGIASAVDAFGSSTWQAQCGYKNQSNYENGRLWLFAAMVWWPWLVVLLVTLFNPPKREAE